MATEVLIIWPHAQDAAELQEAMLRSGLSLEPRILESYPDRAELTELLAGPEPIEAVVVGMTAQQRALQLLNDLHATAPDALAVAAGDSHSAELLRAVMRTGAADFLTPPFALADIQRCFEPIAARPGGRSKGALIAMTPAQGTDGASTIALHVAQLLSGSAGRPALLVDCDIQCGIAAFRLGQHPKYSLADALAHVDRLDELLAKIVVRWRDFDLLVAPDAPLGLMGDHVERLPQALAAMRRHYSSVIADLPPGLSAASLDVLLQANEIHLVCTPEITSLHLGRRRVNDLLQAGVERERLRVLLNRCDSRNPVAGEDIERVLGVPVYHQLANDYEAVTAAAVQGGLVAAESRFGRDLAALAVRIAGAKSAETARRPTSWKRILRLG